MFTAIISILAFISAINFIGRTIIDARADASPDRPGWWLGSKLLGRHYVRITRNGEPLTVRAERWSNGSVMAHVGGKWWVPLVPSTLGWTLRYCGTDYSATDLTGVTNDA